MTHLGTLKGRGRLIASPDTEGVATYRINIYSKHPGGMKSARGTIHAKMLLLYRAFEAGKCTLGLDDGNSVEVVVTSVTNDRGGLKVNTPSTPG